MQHTLQKWSKSKFGDIRRKLRKARGEFEKERQSALYRGSSNREKQLAANIAELLRTEEVMAKQRSRVDWLKEGDRNTAFFHARATVCKHQNRVRSLKSAAGVVCLEKEEIEGIVQSFYTDLFKAQEEIDVHGVLQFVPTKVTDEMNLMPCQPFEAAEVERALFSMGPSKAPGVDGFNANFYQKHWTLIKDEITDAVLGFLNGGHLPEIINRTVIVLIPKVKSPQDITQYRPIALCNVIYKMCSKVLANRLRVVLDVIISEEQSAFVPGRLITDNVICAYESVHSMKRKKGKLAFCAAKLDMMKAYDRVEWPYLQGIMQKLGFAEAWVSLIMKCVTTVSLEVKVNGELLPSFKPTRGLRQGDPISPYLFLICGEGLSCLIKSYDGGWIDRGIRVSYNAPWISHLLFADDCLVFMKADVRSAHRLDAILEIYSKGSGKRVNK
jgi:hypothetical protein